MQYCNYIQVKSNQYVGANLSPENCSFGFDLWLTNPFEIESMVLTI